MKYFLIAGEASGDLHASELISAIARRDPQAQFAFLGGDKMARAAGTQPVIHYRDMAFMGFAEVARHARQISRNFKAARQAITRFMPDRLVLIDYPSFNMRMAKHARKLGIEVSYYIPPKVWAWKERRVKGLKKLVNKMLCIFPFEIDFYAKHGMKAHYVGNPSKEEIDRQISQCPSREAFLKTHGLPDRKIVALLPGSRMAEIKSNLPIMAQAMKQFPQYRGVVAGAPGIDPAVYKELTSLPVLDQDTFSLLCHSHAALVTSGTATLEAALAGVPQVAMYRHNGSRLMRKLRDKVLKIPFVTLPNLIAGREIIPELLLDLCTPDSAARELALILPDRPPRHDMEEAYRQMRAKLGDQKAAEKAAEIICKA